MSLFEMGTYLAYKFANGTYQVDQKAMVDR